MERLAPSAAGHDRCGAGSSDLLLADLPVSMLDVGPRAPSPPDGSAATVRASHDHHDPSTAAHFADRIAAYLGRIVEQARPGCGPQPAALPCTA
jgi:hypothetical protein